MSEKYYGKYRGVVTNNNDPKGAGRIKVRVPSITGDNETKWCLPCLPYVGGGHGNIFIPRVGDVVWIEFERGDKGYPIWTGCWLPTNNKLIGDTIIKTPDGTLHFRDGDIWFTNSIGNSISVQWVIDEFKKTRDWADGRFKLK